MYLKTQLICGSYSMKRECQWAIQKSKQVLSRLLSLTSIKRSKRDSRVILHWISHDVIPANRRGIIGNGAERELRSLPSCVCREPMSYSWTRGEGAKKARQFYCGTTWVTLSKFMHLRKKEQRDVCVFQQQLWVEQALRPFPPSLSPSFYRHLAALGAMTHWPSKKHSSTHPEVILPSPAAAAQLTTVHYSLGGSWKNSVFFHSYTAECPG